MYTAIAANKRNTILIMAVFIGIVGAIGWVFAYLVGEVSVAYAMMFVAIIYAVAQYFLAARLATLVTGAHEIAKSDNPRLFRIVENLSIASGMPMPKVYIIDDPSPNAFATGRDPKHSVVAVTTGILEIMDDRELEAIMAHEISHIRNYDIRVSMIAFGLVSIVAILSDLAIRQFLFGDDRRRNNDPGVIGLVIGLVLIIVAPIIATIIQLAISRQREYLADASGALLTRDAEGLQNALGKLVEFGRPMIRQDASTAHLFISNPLKSDFPGRLFSTHPPLEARITRLQNIEEKF